MLGLVNNIFSTSPVVSSVVESASTKSVLFDADDEYVDTGVNFTNLMRNSFTVSFWAKPADGHPSEIEHMFAAKDSSSDHEFHISLRDDGDVYVHLDTGGLHANRTNSASFSDGSGDYKHVVVVMTKNTGASSTSKVYINGVQQAATLVSDGVDQSGQEGFDIDVTHYIGARNTGGASVQREYAGNIDEFSFWTTSLSDAQILEIYNSGTTTDLTTHTFSNNLQHWWRMGDGTENGSGTTIYDMSNALVMSNATLSGATFSTTVP